MAISAKDVMELRKQTDCGMMECKKALTEADGNFEKAIEILRERGLATAAKKASRVAAEGMVYADYCSRSFKKLRFFRLIVYFPLYAMQNVYLFDNVVLLYNE